MRCSLCRTTVEKSRSDLEGIGWRFDGPLVDGVTSGVCSACVYFVRHNYPKGVPKR